MATPAQAVPTAFVDWSRVTEIIDQAATGGITSIMLFQQDGALLASSRGASVNTVTGALITSIWQDHAAFCAGQEVQALLIDCSNGQVSVARVGAFLLCVVADIRTQPGIIRGKMSALLAALQDLQRIFPQQM